MRCYHEREHRAADDVGSLSFSVSSLAGTLGDRDFLPLGGNPSYKYYEKPYRLPNQYLERLGA